MSSEYLFKIKLMYYSFKYNKYLLYIIWGKLYVALDPFSTK